MDVGESSFEAVVVVGEAFVVEAHEVEDGGVEVVDGDGVFFGFGAEVVGGAVGVSFFDSGSREEAGEGVGVVVAAGAVALKEGHAAEFGGPDNKGVVEHAALFEIGNEGAGGLVHDLGLYAVGVLDVGVGIPVGDAISAAGIGAVEELDDADAFFEEASGEDAVLGVFLFEIGSGICAVLLVDGGGLVGEVHHFGDGELHLAGEFVAGDAGGEVGVAGVFFEVASVESFQDLGGETVVGCGVSLRPIEVGRGIFGIEVGALKGGREEAVAEVVFPGTRHAAGVVDGDEGGEIFVIGAEGVGGPGTEGREALHGEAGVHEVFALGVGGGHGVEGVEEAEVVGVGAKVGEEVGDHLAGLAARFEIPEGFGDVSGGALEGDGGDAGRFLAVVFVEVGLVVEGVNMADGSGTVDDEDAFGGGVVVAGAGEVGVVGIDLGADGGLAGEVGGVVPGIGREEIGKAEAAKGEGGAAHEVAAVEEVATERGDLFWVHDWRRG